MAGPKKYWVNSQSSARIKNDVWKVPCIREHTKLLHKVVKELSPKIAAIHSDQPLLLLVYHFKLVF